MKVLDLSREILELRFRRSGSIDQGEQGSG
jgi:hypothetical protein